MALSDTWLKSNNGKVRESTQVVNDRDGLSVRISPKGKLFSKCDTDLTIHLNVWILAHIQ